MLEIKDEVLSGEPRYTIRDNQGNILQDNVDITLKTPIIQEGTPVNKVLFDNLKVDIVGSTLLMNGGTEKKYTISGELKYADYADIVTKPTTDLGLSENLTFIQEDNNISFLDDYVYNCFYFALDDTHGIAFPLASQIKLINYNNGTEITSISTGISGSLDDVVRIEEKKFVIMYTSSRTIYAKVIKINDDFSGATIGNSYTIYSGSSQTYDRHLIGGDNCFFSTYHFFSGSNSAPWLAKYNVTDTTISVSIANKQIGYTDSYTTYVQIADVGDNFIFRHIYNTSNGGTLQTYQLEYKKSDGSAVRSSYPSNILLKSRPKMINSNNKYYMVDSGKLYEYTYSSGNGLVYRNYYELTLSGNRIVSVLGSKDDVLLCEFMSDYTAPQIALIRISDFLNGKTPKPFQAFTPTVTGGSSLETTYCDITNGNLVVFYSNSTDGGNGVKLKIAETKCQKSESIERTDGIVNNISGNIATVYQRQNVVIESE